MCGIVGIMHLNAENQINTELLDRMVTVLDHRGPDDRGIYVDGPIGLGMTRLSIIDLPGGRQPIFNEDHTLVIIFNGEIYNYKDLYHYLSQRGHCFRTRSDTEVIIHGFEEWGTEVVSHLEGIFAFAIWDKHNQLLFLARDHLGVKPLYYWESPYSLLFASEIKALLQNPEVERAINPVGLRNFLAYGHSIGPDTIFQRVKKLLPGHRLLCGVRQPITLEQYWDVPWEEHPQESESISVKKIKRLLEESVKMQLVSDVPLGVFLSGGLDSSCILSLMSRDMDTPVKTFSVGFNKEGPFYDELTDASVAARHFHSDHQEIKATPKDFIDVLPKLIYHYDEPFADAAAFPTYLVAKLASRHVKVVLTGDGADELFGGYLRYGMEKRLRWLKYLPLGLIDGLASVFHPWASKRPRWQRGLLAVQAKDAAARAASWYLWFPDNMCQDILNSDFLEEIRGIDCFEQFRYYYNRAQTSDHLNRLMYVDLKTQMVDSYLEKVDKASMAVGVEARVPYLSRNLVETAFQIPSTYKIKHGRSKNILRKAMKGLIPQSTLHKPKHGFAVPLEQWLRHDLKDFFAEILFDHHTRQRGIFNFATLERYYQAHISERGSFSTHLWFLLVFELWCRTFLDI
ncbi:MAG: asparagine synthase (glutamine-hydrolyzing) [Deltaproteobacteria bacterium]|nr:asparagine synthase (glutamine-hydrolyzing) [Deltaproteobacteria bacterium]MBM4286858.1 asparagine synthase (glutamine-hydrolyzing) [Deltaproteobacteria bacterium]